MSKKQKAIDAKTQVEEVKNNNQISNGVITKDSKKPEKKSNDKKKDKKKEPSKIGRKAKETMSELKKVTWPTFGEVLKKTGIVIAFVLIFGVFLFGVNYLLGGFANLLIKGSWF